MKKTITSLKLCLLLTVCFLFGRQSQAQTMAAGDIAFIGYNTSTPDGFSFIFLNPVAAGEQLFLTDMGWAGQSYGWMSLLTAEVHLKYTVPVGGHACGTIVSIVESTTTPDLLTVTVSSGTAGTLTFEQNTGFNLSGGDQIIAYQSSTNLPMVANPKFIAAVNGDYTSTNYNSSTGWSNEFTSTTTYNTGESALPVSANGALTTGTNCISLYQGVTEIANAKFNLTVSGATSTLRGQINNPANWSKASSNYSIIPSAYTTGTVTCCTSAAISGQPSNSTVCSGTGTSFTVTATDAASYQWQVNTGSGFTNITNGGVYSGAISSTLNISNTAGMNGYTYQVIATGACGSPATSNTVTLTVNVAPSITTGPSNSTICAGANTSFTVAASAATGYQWQVDQGSGFANVTNGGVYSNATTSTLNITGVTAGMNGYSYRVIVSGACTPSATSSSVALTVNSAPSITAGPSGSTVCAGSNTSFTATVSNATSYQWQVSQGAGFSNISNGGVYSNATTSTLNITGATAGMNGYTYRVIATGACTPNATSSSATLTVNAAPAITQNPFPSAICESDATLFYISASGANSYQWQVNDGSGFVNVSNGAGPTGGIYSGATSSVLIINDAAVAMSGYTYRCIASGPCTPSATSTAAAFTVYANVTYYEDWDNDGYGNLGVTTTTCTGAPGGFVSNFDDCDDNDPNIYPGAVEVCGDGIDNNCDGNVDEGCTTQVVSSQCGTTLNTMGSGINADAVTNAIGYRFRVINGANVQTIDKSTPLFAMTQLATYDYSTTYTVDVAVDFGSGFGPYGTACNITTPAAISQLQTSQCGATIAPTVNIYAANVIGATHYRFRVTEGANVQTIIKTVRYFNMTELASYAFGTTYSVDVAVEMNGSFGPYGSACNVTIPALFTQIQAAQCGTTLAALNTPIYADGVAGASQYRFRITNGANVQTKDNATRILYLTSLASYTYGTTYTIDVAVFANGSWSAYGSACNVTTPYVTTKVQTSQCGTTLPALNTTIYAENVTGATHYRFRVTDGANVQTIDKTTRIFNLTELASYDYGVTYTVDVSVELNGSYGPYGTACNVSAPALATKIQAAQCGTTLAALNTVIYADAIAGATMYRFRVTNGASVQTIDKPVRSFNLTELATYSLGVTYSIDVAVEVNSVWNPYGTACNITTPVPATKVQASQCGTTLAAVTTSIYADNVYGGTQYRFRVTEGANVQIYTSSARLFNLTQLASWSYATTYSIDVAVEVNGTFSAYGTACNVTTPAAVTQVQAAQCGTTLAAIGTVIYANNITGATDYRFRVTNGANVQTIDRTTRSFSLTSLGTYAYATTYSIDVAIKINGVWSAYGPACNVTSPAYPVTQLQTSNCGASIALTGTIYANNVVGVTGYRFRFTEGSNVITVDKTTRSLLLSSVAGLAEGITYNVDISLEYNGTWQPYGAVCALSIASGSKGAAAAETAMETSAAAFEAVTFPNPFSNEFGLKVSTESTELISVTVYDMSGKVMVSQNVPAQEIGTLRMGEGYAAGIYQVRVVQGTESTTLKVVKQ